ncbi:MAG TPA: putative Ig domain-containing protein, partial [Blastocatellia bacterium]
MKRKLSLTALIVCLLSGPALWRGAEATSTLAVSTLFSLKSAEKFVPGFFRSTFDGARVAQTITVTKLDDDNTSGTLRWAVAQANSNAGADIIEFQSGLTGTITLTTAAGGTLTLTDTSGATTINGPTSGDSISVSGNNAMRVFMISGNVTANLNNLTITGGNAGAGGEGGGIWNLGLLTLTNCKITSNLAGRAGGGISTNGSSSLTLINSTVSNNQALDGAGIFDNSRPFTFTNSTISNNTSSANGNAAGFWNRYGTGTIIGCTISGNRSSVTGGITNEGDMTIINSTISGNRADISGGFSGNGGGIINQGPALRLYNCTITGNVGSVGGGIQTQGDFHIVMKNCIVAGNTSTFGGSTPYDLEKTGNDGFNDPVLGASTHNLIGSVTKSGGLTNGVNGNIVGNNGSGTIPIANVLNPSLANNGGPTLTHAPASNSPALDKGSNAAIPSGVTNDQRGDGFPRIINTTVDIGAIETNASTPPTFTNCPPASQTVSADPGACTAAVSFAPVATGLPTPTIVCKIGATTITSPYNFPIGTSNVICTAGNGAAPDATCGFSVTVNDTQAPTLSCPGNQTITATSVAGATVNYTAPSASDNCGAPSVICNPPAGSLFSIGTTSVNCVATDAAMLTNSCGFSVIVNCPAITINPSSLPYGSVGNSYNQSVSALPADIYSYTVSGGALPTGLTLNSATGAITGVPASTGSYTFTITATAGSCSGSQTYTIPVTISPTSPLPGGQAGVAYNYTVSPMPADTYTFSLLSGSLPSGLTLNSITGVLSGTPAATGNFSFTIRAQTAGGSSIALSYTLAIACPTVTLNPASLPNASTGTVY